MGDVRVRGLAAALVLATVTAVAACSASGGTGTGPQTPAGPTSRPPQTSSSAPGTRTASAPTPVPSRSTRPLSTFEKDPAVHALRVWSAQAARTVNSGHYVDARLRALMTPDLAQTMRHVLGGDVGLHYPGPIPFTPIGVSFPNAHTRMIRTCFVGTGFAVNPKTGKAPKPRTVLPISAGAILVNGQWLISQLRNSGFSCKGRTVKDVTW